MAQGVDDVLLEEIRFHRKAIVSYLHLKTPAVVAMVDHMSGHTTVDADILARNESGLVGT